MLVLNTVVVAFILLVYVNTKNTTTNDTVNVRIDGRLYFNGKPAKWTAEMSEPGSASFNNVQKTLCESNLEALKKYSTYAAFWTGCDLISANKTNTVCDIHLDRNKAKNAKVNYKSHTFLGIVKSSLQKYSPIEKDVYYYGSVTSVTISESRRLAPCLAALLTMSSALSIMPQ
ncbi:hypothetical protein D915_004303 [Fasciola hepatica]|uniref:Uncharacterized protein n=1 Tax=Fasciola hepatica TaxID=6192 RepID=A0A4E0RDY1_FASHE|nr:hypothetical protein D915_004303 [Fasciola hepatica]